MERLKQVGASLLHWSWVKAVLYWIIVSAGTVAECAFLVASLWMSLNSSIHNFVRIFLSEDATVHFSELATAAYVGLPECILFLASVTVISHFRTWLYNRKNKIALVWSIAYALPTLAFLVLSLFTLGSSVLNVHFEMPGYLIVIRALAGYLFGFIAFLYWSLGTPQEVDRLKEKDVLINQLEEKVKGLTAEMEKQTGILVEQVDTLKAEVEIQKRIVAEAQNQRILLQNEVKKGTDDALQAYGEECKNWLKSGIKTAPVDNISRYTGHSKQKIVKAKLRRSPRNQDLILIESLIEWLKETPPSGPQLHIVNG
jgi:hypothetical protein